MRCIEHCQKGTGLGYGKVSHKGRAEVMHRVAYCFARGIDIELIRGSLVRHKCDNPRCINPTHLELGTVQDNSDDMVSRGRSLRGAKHHQAVLTAEQVKYIRDTYVPHSRTHGSRQLAKELNVSCRSVRYAVANQTWKD